MQSEPDWVIELYKIAKKLFLSTFVVVSFLVYVVHERFVELTSPTAEATQPQDTSLRQPTGPVAAVTPQPTVEIPTAPPSVFQPQPQPSPTAPAQPTAVPPTAVPTDPPIAQGQYKDGVYTGPEIDAYYGLVQVQATIQNGQIASVNFLEYPQHRRTSQEINAQAMPYLQTEAMQAQSANVNIISGATLTSEAFIMSLQSALDTAKP